MRTETLVSGDGTRTVYTYDDAGHQTRMTDYGPDGRIKCDCLYRLSGEGDVLGWEVLDGEGSLIRRFEVDYNPQGLESEEREYDAAGALVSRVQYLYDAGGLRVGERHLDAEGNQLGETAV